MPGASVMNDRDVVVFGEHASTVRPFPSACGVLLKIGPIAKPSAGSAKAPRGDDPGAVGAPTVMKRRRVTVSPSKAPGMPRSSVYLDLCLRCLSATGGEQYRGGIQGDAGSGSGTCAHRLERLR